MINHLSSAVVFCVPSHVALDCSLRRVKKNMESMLNAQPLVPKYSENGSKRYGFSSNFETNLPSN